MLKTKLGLASLNFFLNYLKQIVCLNKNIMQLLQHAFSTLTRDQGFDKMHNKERAITIKCTQHIIWTYKAGPPYQLGLNLNIPWAKKADGHPNLQVRVDFILPFSFVQLSTPIWNLDPICSLWTLMEPSGAGRSL